jgi:hypothetical protein
MGHGSYFFGFSGPLENGIVGQGFSLAKRKQT